MQKTINKLKELEKQLNGLIIGRENVSKALVLALASNSHMLILGKHGEAKSYIVDKLCKITKLNYYYKQFHNETQLKDVVGVLNPIEFQKGKLDLLKTKFWDSNILFIDEFLRGRSECLDFLMEVLVERKCSKTILGEVNLPIVSCICTSNPLTDEYNTERMDLALKDRFSFIIYLKHLIEDKPELLKEVIKTNNGHLTDIKFDYDELIELRKEAVEKVNVDADFISELFQKLRDYGFLFSSRFIKNYAQIVKVVLL